MDDPAALYHAHYGTLVEIATSEFEIPESQAEWMADVVLVSILNHIDHVSDPGTWLIASMRYAAHRYNEMKSRDAGTDRIPFGRPRATRRGN